ncbi:MAG: hypothetical protein VW713_09815, partial [Alphaproteobacteria bacterium]
LRLSSAFALEPDLDPESWAMTAKINLQQVSAQMAIMGPYLLLFGGQGRLGENMIFGESVKATTNI